MSSKSQTERHRIYDRVRTKIEDFDTPSNNSDSVAVTSTSFTNTESNSGVDKPGWRNQIASGNSATNAVSADRARFTATTPSSARIEFIRRKNTTSGWKVYRTELIDTQQKLVPMTKPTGVSHAASASNRAISMFVSKARLKLSPGNLGVTFGELNETLRMIANPGRSIVRGMGKYLAEANKSLRRNKRLSNPKKLSTVSDLWLEYSFGWKPLIAEAEDLAKAAASTAVGISMPHVSAQAVSDNFISETRYQQPIQAGGGINFSIRTISYTKCVVGGRLKAENLTPGNFPLRFGLTLDNFVPTLWELVPWSFAIDYFTGVGDYISSMCFPTSRFQYVYRSRFTRVKKYTGDAYVVGDPRQDSNSLTVLTSYSPGYTAAEVDAFDRDAQVSLVSPVSFSLPASKYAYANLSALLQLRLSNQRRS